MSQTNLTIKTINNFSGFMALKQDWNKLAKLTDSSDIFLRHEWFEAAWGWFEESCTAKLIIVQIEGTIAGICPIMLEIEKKGIFRVKKWSLMLIPDTQQIDIICNPEQRELVLGLIAEEISANRDWHYFEVAKLKQKSKTAGLLKEKFHSFGNKFSSDIIDESLCIDLDGTWEEYYKTRSRRLKKGNNYIKNLLMRSGMDFEVKKFSGDGIDEKVLKDVVSISANSWKAHTGLTFDNPGPHKFLTELIKRMKEKGWVTIWFFYYENRPIAYELQLTHENIISALRSDYHVEYDELSPGTYLNWKILEKLFEQGFHYYNMGSGTNKYKLRWTNNAIALSNYRVFNNRTAMGKWLGFWEITLKPMIKRHMPNKIKKGTA